MAQEEDTTDDPAQDAVDAANCPTCGGQVDKHGMSKNARPKTPPYQLSKYSPQDRGFGDLYNDAMGAAARMTAAMQKPQE